LFTTPEDEAAAERIWRTAGWSSGDSVVCLNPGAAFGSAKYWSVESFANLAWRFASADRRVLVLCGPAERPMARQIAAQAGDPRVQSLADAPLSLGLTKACIRRSDLLVTTDSGPRHFAAAFDKPVVTLFGPTHIAWTETYHAKAQHIQKAVPCGPCQLRTCPLDHRCMTGITPEEVFAAAESLLSRCARPREVRHAG
jgi:heptosyltransferase-2